MFTSLSQPIRQFPLTSFCLMLISFSIIGYLIVTRYLMEKQIRQRLSKIIFIITFACAVSLLAMYIYQISNIFLAEQLWNIVLSIEVIMCTIIIPIALFLKLTWLTHKINVLGINTQISLVSVALIFLYIYLLLVSSEEIKIQKKIDGNVGFLTKQHVNILVEILVEYGVVIMAMMSAYGAIWVPYIYFNYTQTKREDLQAARQKVKNQIFFIIQQIKKNKYSIIKLKQQRQKLSETIKQKQSKQQRKSFLSRGLSSIKSVISHSSDTDARKQISSINQKIDFHHKEIQTLNKVHHESFSIYREISDEERKHMISETYMGKLFKAFSFVLTIYSLSKFVLTVWNMVFGRKRSTDPIQRFFSFIAWLFYLDLNKNFRNYIQYTSFGFMGYLMISNVRSFSINIKNCIDFFFRRRRLNILSPDTLVLLLSEMYGIYFLTAVMLLQAGLPKAYVAKLEDIIGNIRILQHFQRFDVLFFWGCIFSLILIIINQMQRKQKLSIIKQRNYA